jgi:hypothetical protein
MCLKEKILYFGNLGSCVPHFFALGLQLGNFSSLNRINRISYTLSVLSGFYQIFFLWRFYKILDDLWKSYHIEHKDIVDLKCGFIVEKINLNS